MPLPREDVEATTPKFLRDKYAIVGVGETDYMRGSDKSTRALAAIAQLGRWEDAPDVPSRTADPSGWLAWARADDDRAWVTEFAPAHDNLGKALASQGPARLSEAIYSFGRALDLDPRLESARKNLEAAKRAQRAATAPTPSDLR